MDHNKHSFHKSNRTTNRGESAIKQGVHYGDDDDDTSVEIEKHYSYPKMSIGKQWILSDYSTCPLNGYLVMCVGIGSRPVKFFENEILWNDEHYIICCIDPKYWMTEPESKECNQYTVRFVEPNRRDERKEKCIN
jgi:hypothetical protein